MSIQLADEKKKKDDRIPTWMIAGGVAAVFALFTAVAVYQIKKSRKQQLRDARYGEDYPESNFSGKLTKYWNFTKRTFTAVSKVVGDFLTSKDKLRAPATMAARSDTPLVDAAAASSGSTFQSDAEL